MEEYELVYVEEQAEVIPTLGPRPTKAHRDDAAFDLTAIEGAVVPPQGRATVNTGTRIGIPFTHAGLILPRSGLAANHGITVLNSPGLIDPGYLGEIKVILHNTTSQPFFVNPGDRIAQLALIRLALVQFQDVSTEDFDALPSQRETRGLGSTGLHPNFGRYAAGEMSEADYADDLARRVDQAVGTQPTPRLSELGDHHTTDQSDPYLSHRDPGDENDFDSAA